MARSGIGVAVIGAGMAGRAHAAGYRRAGTLYEPGLPEVRLVAIADANPEFARDAARRFGYARAETDWRRIAEAADIDAVSVVVANRLHRGIVEGLLSAGKHVLCEKPLAPSAADARAMADAARAAGRIGATGFTYRRAPAIAAIAERIQSGAIGHPNHFSGHYWCDYGCDPRRPMSWRYKGGLGSGVLADVASHLVDVAELVCGPIVSVSGAVIRTLISERPLPLHAVSGHAAAATSDQTEQVENEDVATFTALFASGAAGTFSVSRIAFGLPNALGFEVFCEHGAARFDLARPGEFAFADTAPEPIVNGFRSVLVGPQHPYLARGLPMDFPGVNFGQSDLFSFQARAFLEQIAGIAGLPPCPSFDDGVRNLELLAAVTASAKAGGAAMAIEARAGVPEQRGKHP